MAREAVLSHLDLARQLVLE
jgi:hypothetical protein